MIISPSGIPVEEKCLTYIQHSSLEELFTAIPYLSMPKRQYTSEQLGLSETEICLWLAKRRQQAYYMRKHTCQFKGEHVRTFKIIIAFVWKSVCKDSAFAVNSILYAEFQSLMEISPSLPQSVGTVIFPKKPAAVTICLHLTCGFYLRLATIKAHTL